jgi:hypothetical protein
MNFVDGKIELSKVESHHNIDPWSTPNTEEITKNKRQADF